MLRSSLPKVAAELGVTVDLAARQSAEMIAKSAKENCPVGHTGKLRQSIHVEHTGLGDYKVVAGDEQVFYGLLVEHGTAYSAPRPFLGPAAEGARPAVQALTMAYMKSKLLLSADFADFDGTELDL